MNCFDLVSVVLDELWNDMEGDEHKKSRAVKEEITNLSINYCAISQNSVIDYSNPVTQFAYIFKYTSTHGDYLYQLLKKIKEKYEFPENGCFKMSSLGGGPGSDLIGCLKFFEERKAHDLNFTYNSFDKDKHWSYCWANVSGCITRDDCEARLCKVLSPIFHELDITDDSEVKRIRKFLNADLYTMLFFMSEVSKKREDAKAFFDYFFENVNSGSCIAFIDNNMETIFSWFDEYIDERYEVLASGEDIWFASANEQKSSVKKYMELLDHAPRIKGDISYRVVRKL